jgi:hypothetical protein
MNCELPGRGRGAVLFIVALARHRHQIVERADRREGLRHHQHVELRNRRNWREVLDGIKGERLVGEHAHGGVGKARRPRMGSRCGSA